jgi:DNA-directed RNA polymerase specialized sigma24 family protein
MDRLELDQRLSRMSTMWTVVLNAHGGGADSANADLARLAQRYSGVVYRYLLGATRDPDAAADLSQEFALRILRGAFRHADPARGRFRDYLKTALIHLVDDFHTAQRARPRPLPLNVPAGPSESEGPVTSDGFLETWRAELLDRTWKALAAAQPTYHAVLLFRVDNPEAPSAQIAEQLGAWLGTPMRADQVRKALQRSHAKFAELLVEEVAASLGNPSRDELTDELREIDLLKYCSSALERRP